MKLHQQLYIIAVSCSLLLNSCDWFKKSLQETLHNKEQAASSSATENDADRLQGANEDAEKTIFSSDTVALRKAEEALRKRPELRGKKLVIYESIHFYDDHRIYLKIQNPDNPTYVDEYRYADGSWSDPQPVVMSKDERIEERSAELIKIPFTNAYHVYRILTEKRKEINSKDADYTPYVVIFDNEIRWYPTTISNARSEYELDYNEDGTLKSFEQK